MIVWRGIVLDFIRSGLNRMIMMKMKMKMKMRTKMTVKIDNIMRTEIIPTQN